MNPREKEDFEFDKWADATLRKLEQAVSVFDPDEVEVELAGDVLTLAFADEQKIVVNRQRAGRQIWMAAKRKAWHFCPDATGTHWRAGEHELWATLETVLAGQLGRAVHLTRG